MCTHNCRMSSLGDVVTLQIGLLYGGRVLNCLSLYCLGDIELKSFQISISYNFEKVETFQK